MPSWNDLISELDSQPNDQEKTAWLNTKYLETLRGISSRKNWRNVIYYASAFLQKPQAPATNLQITHEEVNGFMAVMYGMDWSRDLTLLLHTPGGITNAAESIVSYLWSKFDHIEIIIPTFAMSAGTMISLAANHIIMGRHSQLGPIDPLMPMPGRYVSARAVVDQFERARNEISGDRNLAHVWAPILQSLGPSLLQEAQNALDYGERMVAEWLAQRMFKDKENPVSLANQTAKHFNASEHKSHGRRIGREEARDNDVIVYDLEDDQELQEYVLTAYHLTTIVFEKTPATKILSSSTDRKWIKNWMSGQTR
jgi:hypothetical protein